MTNYLVNSGGIGLAAAIAIGALCAGACALTAGSACVACIEGVSAISTVTIAGWILLCSASNS